MGVALIASHRGCLKFNAKEIAMLVLTRKLHEQIKIGQDITITIVRLHR